MSMCSWSVSGEGQDYHMFYSLTPLYTDLGCIRQRYAYVDLPGPRRFWNLCASI
jgi:hypothetical protein